MAIWTSEIKELEKLYQSLKGQLPDLEKELERLVRGDDENMILLYSRRCLEVIITDLCECELKRPRKTEPLKGIIDKLNKEEKVPSYIISSMHGLNELSTYGAHPKDFDPEQVKPVLVNLDIIIKWYLKYKEPGSDIKIKPPEEITHGIKRTENVKKDITISRKRLAGILGGSIGIIASVFAVLYFSNIIGGDKQTKELEKSIAVLPFKLLSDESEKQYLADGMMDAILMHLQKFRDIKVLSRTSVEQYRGTSKSVRDISHELDVGFLLEGSFQKHGDNVKLIVKLIQSNEDRHAWANEYNIPWKDVFLVQSDVAKTIAGELHTTISPEELVLVNKIPTSDLNAYDLYMKAQDYKNDFEKTRNISSYNKALSFYRAALEIDSVYAKVYTGLAAIYYNRYYWETYFKENFLDTCLKLVNKALSLDDQQEEAYYIKGNYYGEKGDTASAMDNFNKALKINPNYYLAYRAKGNGLTNILHNYVGGIDNYTKALSLIRGDERPILLRLLGRVYLDIGFAEKARNLYAEAYSLDGLKASYYGVTSWLEFSNENFEEAVKLSKMSKEIDSTYLTDLIVYLIPPGHENDAYIHAKQLINKSKRTGSLSLYQSHRIGYALIRAGKTKEGQSYLNQQIKYSQDNIKLSRTFAQRKAAHYDLAATYAYLGEMEKAYQYLEEFGKLNFYQKWWLSMAKNDPFFADMRDEEQFQKLLQNMQTKHQAEHERVRKWLEEQGML